MTVGFCFSYCMGDTERIGSDQLSPSGVDSSGVLHCVDVFHAHRVGFHQEGCLFEQPGVGGESPYEHG